MKIHLSVKGVAPLYKLLGKKNDIDITLERTETALKTAKKIVGV